MNASTIQTIPADLLHAAAGAAPEETAILEGAAGGSDPALPPEPGPAAWARLGALAGAVRSAGLKLGLVWTVDFCVPAALTALGDLHESDPAPAALIGLLGGANAFHA
jgi:hypothetical protein